MDKKGDWKSIEEDLRKHIMEVAIKDLNIHNILEGERRQPCSQQQELSIKANGDLYPYCTDIFNGSHRLGVAGLLVERK